MNIKAIFPTGVSELVVNGLHQWDYGQKLEIHADDLPAMVEVHFACAGMSEAVVRSCALLNGVAVADIPDQCLEQTTPVVAWVYEILDTAGTTTKTVILNVTARTKPSLGAVVPPEVSDRYTEALTEMEGLVGAMRDGQITAARARLADEATHAVNASEASWAESAGHANEASHAEAASKADVADALSATEIDPDAQIVTPGLYAISYCQDGIFAKETAIISLDSVTGYYVSGDIQYIPDADGQTVQMFVAKNGATITKIRRLSPYENA